MLRKRITTAVLLGALIGSTLFLLPPIAFDVLIFVSVVFAVAEFNRLALSRLRFYRITALAGGCCVAAAQLWRPAALPIDVVLIVVVFGLAVAYLWRATTLEAYVTHLGIALLGAVYIGLTLPYLGLLRREPDGVALVMLTLSMVALSDTAAYTAGKMFGRRRFSMASPNKTLEGFYANFLGCMVAMVAVRALLLPSLPLLKGLGLALLIGFVGPFGDLIESAVKRAAHAKDSGASLPGHGGVLDRCDAYLFAAPVVYYYVQWVL